MHSGLRHGSEPRLGRTRDVGPRRHELPFPRLSSARRRQDSGFPGEGTDGPAGQRAAGSWASVRGLGPVTWHDFEHLASGHLWQEHSALRVTFSNKRTASPASHRRSGSPRWASWPLPGQPSFIARGPGVPGLLPAGRGLGQVPSACAQTQCCPAAVDASHARAPRFQGYEGLVEGGENIKPANWLSVSNIIQLVRPRWSLPAREHACARTSRRDAGARTDAGTDRHWARLQAAMGSCSRDGPRQGHRQSSRSGEGGADTWERHGTASDGPPTPAPGFHFIAALSLPLTKAGASHPLTERGHLGGPGSPGVGVFKPCLSGETLFLP